jgi:ABC-type multidrug transport system ATPase subunit
MKITEQTKRLIIEKVIANSYLTQFYFKQDFISFLSRLLPLREMPSEDPRYGNAEDDAYQHLVNNQDWTIVELFTQRFDFLTDTKKFVTLLNLIVNPEFCQDIDEIHKIVLQTNRFLEKEKYAFSVFDYTESNIPIYHIAQTIENRIEPIHKKNNIPVYVIFSPTYHFSNFNTHPKPPVFPSFNLVLNRGWNDYSLVSEYCLFFYSSEEEEVKIGELKIISEDLKVIEKNTTLENVLPDNFIELTERFCSLGQSYHFYENLKNVLGNNFENFLWALKDCAFFPILLESFETHPYFKSSLIRNDNQEQLLREVKFRIYGLDLSTLYSFTYNFQPKFTKETKEIQLNFQNDLYFDRIYGIIGKNGVGKTQFISSLPLDISENNSKVFNPSTPQFSKVIAVSYSAFDNFKIPKSNANFNYVFCGLKNRDGKKLSDSGLVNRFHHSWKKIREYNRFRSWFKLLQNFIEEEYINQMFNDDGDELDISSFSDVRKKLSSGQTLLLYIITEIVANIRNNSLILYDEPETHLHPNAISQLVNTLFQLLERFDSYCIITTHSPIIIRELTSKNVYVFDRKDSYFNVKQLPIETYGENLTTLTDEVFGNRSIPNHYKNALKKMVDANFSYEDIISKISGNLPLSLNASLYLQSLIDEKE